MKAIVTRIYLHSSPHFYIVEFFLKSPEIPLKERTWKIFAKEKSFFQFFQPSVASLIRQNYINGPVRLEIFMSKHSNIYDTYS